MKYLIYSDCHFSEYSSILRSRGKRFSTRLENLITTLNYLEALAQQFCDGVICLGDFFDRNFLKCEEITALQEISWAHLPHYFLVGNHELGSDSMSSVHGLLLNKDVYVISEPSAFILGDVECCFLPYMLESNRKTIEETFGPKQHKRVIFSHNDIAGISLGRFISKVGYDISDISNSCDLFINGHIHNGGAVSDKIINLGNITGQNFSEDSTKFAHCYAIFDTDTFHYDLYENPYAINFYKFNDISSIDISQLKSNAVITYSCYEKDVDMIKTLLSCKSILASKVNVIHPTTIDIQNISLDNTIDHYKQFEEYVKNNFEMSDIVAAELSEVLR